MGSENELEDEVEDVPTKKACVSGLGSEVSPVFSYVSSIEMLESFRSCKPVSIGSASSSSILHQISEMYPSKRP